MPGWDEGPVFATAAAGRISKQSIAGNSRAAVERVHIINSFLRLVASVSSAPPQCVYRASVSAVNARSSAIVNAGSERLCGPGAQAPYLLGRDVRAYHRGVSSVLF